MVRLLPPLPCTQGGGLGWGVLRHRTRPTLTLDENRLQHRMEILEHVGVHKPDHVQTFLSQHLTPSFVILLSPLVRISVQLHDELRSRAIEVDDVPANRVLPTELKPVQAVSTEAPPELLLSGR